MYVYVKIHVKNARDSTR